MIKHCPLRSFGCLLFELATVPLHWLRPSAVITQRFANAQAVAWNRLNRASESIRPANRLRPVQGVCKCYRIDKLPFGTLFAIIDLLTRCYKTRCGQPPTRPPTTAGPLPLRTTTHRTSKGGSSTTTKRLSSRGQRGLDHPSRSSKSPARGEHRYSTHANGGLNRGAWQTQPEMVRCRRMSKLPLSIDQKSQPGKPP